MRGELPIGKIKGRPKSSAPGQANTSTKFETSPAKKKTFPEVLACVISRPGQSQGFSINTVVIH